MAANKRVSRERVRSASVNSNVAVASDLRRTAARSERRALMRADAVLRCVAIAVEYDGWTSDEPDYAEAIEVARHLISQSIERLESGSDSGSLTISAVRSGQESST